jgi:hypothetical protein
MANQMIALQARNPQLPDPARATTQMANMLNMASQQRAAQLQGERIRQEMEYAQAGEAREVELQAPRLAKAQAEATGMDLKTGAEFNAFVYTALKNADSPDQVVGFAQRIASLPQFQNPLYQGMLSDAVENMPTDPALFQPWKEASASKALTAAEELSNEFTTQNLGTSTRVIRTPKYGRGPAEVVEGSQAAVDIKPTVVNVEGIGPVIVDPNTGKGFPAAAGAAGGYTPPRVGVPTAGALGGGNTFSRMIQQESGGRQFDRSGRPLTSSAGAIGIAQVMPKTAPEAARLAGLPFDDNRYRNDPEYNLALGKAYYDKQLADFGDERLAAAAYNAGPSAIRRALQKGGPDNWINHVPRETQNYVRSVFGEGRGAAGAMTQGRGSAGVEEPRTLTQTASAAERQRKVKTFQDLTGVDLNTQLNKETDPVSKLIKGSTGGMVEALGAEIVGAIPESLGGGATPGMKNIGQLETIATTLTLAFAPDGRLSTGVSNEDRRVIERQLGVIQDPMIPSGKRLAAWGEVKRIMARTIGLTTGQKTTPTTGGSQGNGRPSLDSFRRKK